MAFFGPAGNSFEMNFYNGPMTENDWGKLKFLGGPRHNWGEKERIDRQVILTLDLALGEVGSPCLVTCGTSGKHIEHSLHYEGKALDIMFPDLQLQDLPDLFYIFCRYAAFNGIGMYSEWRMDLGPGIGQPPKIGGFHLDVRPTTRKALWIKHEGPYLGFTTENLKPFFAAL